MSKTAYPNLDDLRMLLMSSGILSSPLTDAQENLLQQEALDAAADEWGRVTGYVPFLADTVDRTWTIDPPGPTIRGTRYGYRARGGERFLELPTAFTSITSVTTGVDQSSVGTVRTLNTDYYLYPANAAAQGQPFTRLEFVLPVWGSQQSVRVVGKAGWFTTVPNDAWQAILFMAAINLLPSLELAQFGGLQSWKDADVSETYGAKPYAGVVDGWTKRIEKAQMNYMRV